MLPLCMDFLQPADGTRYLYKNMRRIKDWTQRVKWQADQDRAGPPDCRADLRRQAIGLENPLARPGMRSEYASTDAWRSTRRPGQEAWLAVWRCAATCTVVWLRFVVLHKRLPPCWNLDNSSPEPP